jgi:hypothetical protein
LTNFDLVRVLAFLEEDVDQVLVFVLFWEDDFRLLVRRLGWSLHIKYIEIKIHLDKQTKKENLSYSNEDNVHMLVSSWNSDNSVLNFSWLIRGAVDVHVTVNLWGVCWGSIFLLLLGGGPISSASSLGTSHQGENSNLNYNLIFNLFSKKSLKTYQESVHV